MNLGRLLRLPEEWREHAELLREHGSEGAARTCEKHADELEERIREWEAEPLTPSEAAQETDYTPDHIRRLIREHNSVANAGDESSLKIHRRDLPRKAGHHGCSGRTSDTSSGSRSRVARTVVDSE